MGPAGAGAPRRVKPEPEQPEPCTPGPGPRAWPWPRQGPCSHTRIAAQCIDNSRPHGCAPPAQAGHRHLLLPPLLCPAGRGPALPCTRTRKAVEAAAAAIAAQTITACTQGTGPGPTSRAAPDARPAGADQNRIAPKGARAGHEGRRHARRGRPRASGTAAELVGCVRAPQQQLGHRLFGYSARGFFTRAPDPLRLGTKSERTFGTGPAPARKSAVGGAASKLSFSRTSSRRCVPRRRRGWSEARPRASVWESRMRMVLCLLRASYNVTIADTDAVFLSDASSWLSGFDLVASRAAPKSTPYTARLFDGVGVDATRTNTPSQVAGQLPRVVFGKMGRLTLFRTGALQHGRPRNFINQASGGKDPVAPGRSAGRELRPPRGQYKLGA